VNMRCSPGGTLQRTMRKVANLFRELFLPTGFRIFDTTFSRSEISSLNPRSADRSSRQQDQRAKSLNVLCSSLNWTAYLGAHKDEFSIEKLREIFAIQSSQGDSHLN
jgi:hypothetical protein